MKNWIALSLATVLLGACTSEVSEEDTLSQEEEAAVEEEVSDAGATDEELAPVNSESLDESEIISDITQYKEFEEQDVFDPSQFDAYLVEDSYGVRIIVFVEEGTQRFKSIFTKEDNRFKVIDLETEEVLLDAPI